VDFLDENHLTAQSATYTTCERNDEESWKPSWVLRADSVEFDMETEVGVRARGRDPFQGRADPGVSQGELSLERQAQIGLAAADHQHGLDERL
jgi:hypothetical protein